MNKTAVYSSNRYWEFWEDYGNSKELHWIYTLSYKGDKYHVRKQTKNGH